jgi:hypothetical protein
MGKDIIMREPSEGGVDLAAALEGGIDESVLAVVFSPGDDPESYRFQWRWLLPWRAAIMLVSMQRDDIAILKSHYSETSYKQRSSSWVWLFVSIMLWLIGMMFGLGFVASKLGPFVFNYLTIP